MISFRLLFLLFALFALPATAQDNAAPAAPAPAAMATPTEPLYDPTRPEPGFDKDIETKDSIDYTMDDGVMSQEEMEKEARYVAYLCNINSYQRELYNCGCIAGAFLKLREKEGPFFDQANMINNLNGDGQMSACVRTDQVAGMSYQDCMNYYAAYRELETDGPSFCGCVARRVAASFKKSPVMNPTYVGSLKVQAMRICEDPSKREVIP